MNVQLIDRHDRPCFRMYTSEHVWSRFWTHACSSTESVARNPPTRDFELPPSSLTEIVRMLEADLVAAKHEARTAPSPAPTSQVEILGDVLHLDLRTESHARLQRLAVLYKALLRPLAEHVSIRVMFVPPLASSRYYLAALLKHEAKGMDRTQARAALIQEYERLRASEAATDELRTIWTKDCAALQDGLVMKELIDYLASWDLVQESPDGAQIVATSKLRAIAL